MAGGEPTKGYPGTITAVINSCVKNGSNYDFNASFSFDCEGFSGAKLPTLTIHSSSGGSITFTGNAYENDPLVKDFSLSAEAGDTITISSASWSDPSDSAQSALLQSATEIYTIPDEVETKGATWGATAWGGIYRPAGKLKEVSISGAVDVAKIFSNTISGSLRVAKVSSKTISGVVRVEKTLAKDISGRLLVMGTQTVDISGAVYVKNPNERVVEKNISGIVDVLKANSVGMSGKIHIQRAETSDISGHIRVEKTQTATVAGAVRVARANAVDISGSVRVRVSTPEKLPTDWEYGGEPEAEDWGGEDKPTDSWSDSPVADANEWSETTKPSDGWSGAGDVEPVNWDYPLEDNA